MQIRSLAAAVLGCAALFVGSTALAANESCADRYRAAYTEASLVDAGVAGFASWMNSSKLKAAQGLYALYVDTQENVENVSPAKRAIVAALAASGVQEKDALGEFVRQMESGQLCTRRGGTLTVVQVIDSLEKSLVR